MLVRSSSATAVRAGRLEAVDAPNREKSEAACVGTYGVLFAALLLPASFILLSSSFSKKLALDDDQKRSLNDGFARGSDVFPESWPLEGVLEAVA